MGPEVTTQPPPTGIAPQIVEFVRLRRWLEVLAVTAISTVSFTILMKLTLVLLFRNGISICWPMVGIVTAVMLKLPRRHWPWVIAGTIGGHLVVEWGDESYPTMVADTVCDVFEILLAVFALPRFTNLSDWIRQRNLVVRFLALPAILGPVLTAIPVGIVFSRELHTGFWKNASQWCLGDSLGIVLWLPLALVVMSPETYNLLRWKGLPRTIGLVGLVLLASLSIFRWISLPIAFVIMPILLMVALKLGFSASVLLVNTLSLIAAVATRHGMGPFGQVNADYRVIVLQAYLAVCMLSCFPISIIMMERDALERELREACASMEKLATRDGLTGLANRRQFDDKLTAEWGRATRERRRIGLLMIDVDCFKRYNDCYGHVAGDECLRRIADSLGSGARRSGDLVGRYGGEEFFALMPDTDLAGLLLVAEKIRSDVEALELEHKENTHRIVTISIGCCSKVPKPGEMPECLVIAADQALYVAKQSGRNRVEGFRSVEKEARLARA